MPWALNPKHRNPEPRTPKPLNPTAKGHEGAKKKKPLNPKDPKLRHKEALDPWFPPPSAEEPSWEVGALGFNRHMTVIFVRVILVVAVRVAVAGKRVIMVIIQRIVIRS